MPERATPEAIQFFDFAIAFGFGDGQEDQFDPEIQTEPHDLTDPAWRFVAATEGRVVVELQKRWNSKGLPGLEQMANDGRTLFVGSNRLHTGAGPQIQGMKGIDFDAVFQIATRPIERVQDAGYDLERPRKVTRPRGRGNQAMLPQDALDGGS